MREFFFEAVIIEEGFDTTRDDRRLEYLIDIRSAMHIHCEHLRYEGL